MAAQVRGFLGEPTDKWHQTDSNNFMLVLLEEKIVC